MTTQAIIISCFIAIAIIIAFAGLVFRWSQRRPHHELLRPASTSVLGILTRRLERKPADARGQEGHRATSSNKNPHA